MKQQKNFNPRSHEGSDGCHGNQRRRDSISIHAPTRGATVSAQNWAACIVDFNPRSHEGSDFSGQWMVCCLIDFNPRSHEGSDETGRSGVRTGKNFNPRSHEGSDAAMCGLFMYSRIFQSTLPRGERLRFPLPLHPGY